MRASGLPTRAFIQNTRNSKYRFHAERAPPAAPRAAKEKLSELRQPRGLDPCEERRDVEDAAGREESEGKAWEPPGREGGGQPGERTRGWDGRVTWSPGSRSQIHDPQIPDPQSRSRPHLSRRRRPRARTAARPPRLAGSNARGAASPTCGASPPPRGLPGVVVRRGCGAAWASVPSPRPIPAGNGRAREMPPEGTARAGAAGKERLLLGFSRING